MAIFQYTAVSKDGKRESAQLEAGSLIAAGHFLKQQGMMPLELSEVKESALTRLLRTFSTVPLKEKIVFIENLGLMIKSGIAAPRALKILAHQTGNKRFQYVLADLATKVEGGRSLHESMAAHPKIFSYIFITMVKVGEVGGSLEKSLEHLSVQLEREADLRSKVKGAMIYPSVIISAMLIIGVLLAIFVLPTLTGIFSEFNTELPIQTRAVIAISDFMSQNAVLVIGFMIAAIVACISLLRTAQGMRLADWLLLRLPILGKIMQKINLARFSRVLGSMMKSGVTIIEGLGVAAESVGNIYYREAILETASNVKLGKPITETLSKHERLFSYLVVQMLSVGEETGSLENILDQLSAHYEAEVDATMRNLSSIIEPVLLLVIGGVVGFLALALIGPIYNISQSIQ